MFNDVRRHQRFLSTVALTGLLLLATTCSQAADPQVDPRVQALISKHLRVDPSYSPGEILARDQVEPIYNEILALGLQPTSDPESTYSPILRESHYLVQLLRSPSGRALMKKIGNEPLAYDRLDRLSWLSGGKGWVEHIVASPQGAELFAQLFSEEGIKKIEQQFVDEPTSRNMHLPTGKIYTEAALGQALTKSLRKQMEMKQAAEQTAKSAKGTTKGAAAKSKKPAGA